MMHKTSNSRGFIATIAVVLIASMIMAFSLATLDAAALYADSVYRREVRIQADLNANSCLETVKIMAQEDYFLSDSVSLPEFGCIAEVEGGVIGSIRQTR